MLLRKESITLSTLKVDVASFVSMKKKTEEVKM